jgi:hypothetical protein
MFYIGTYKRINCKTLIVVNLHYSKIKECNCKKSQNRSVKLHYLKLFGINCLKLFEPELKFSFVVLVIKAREFFLLRMYQQSEDSISRPISSHFCKQATALNF